MPIKQAKGDKVCIDCGAATGGKRCVSCHCKYMNTIPRTKPVRFHRRPNRQGNKHPNWAGDKVGYAGVHKWVKKFKVKPERCTNCSGCKPLDLANISGEYRRDVNDFTWLCRRCHMQSDGRLFNLRNYGNTHATQKTQEQR